MAAPNRISAQQARSKTLNAEALLVCAYEDAEKFVENNLQGAIPLSEFKSRLPALSREQEIIFYCA